MKTRCGWGGVARTSLDGIDAPICQDGRSGGFTELLARAEVSHDALIDFPSEKAFKASDDVAFRPSIRPASDDIVDRRLVIAHTDGVVARIVTGPHDAHRQDPHLPIRYDTGRPSSVIRLRISQPRTTSLPCPVGLRARRPSPMMDLYRKNVFSTRL